MSVNLTKFSKGGGCGCKIDPATLDKLLKGLKPHGLFPDLLVGADFADDSAVYKLNSDQSLVVSTDFFTPIINDPFNFGRIAATNALSDIYAMGGSPILALAVLGYPADKIHEETIRRILEGGQSVCSNMGIPVGGGHSIDSNDLFYGLVAVGLVSNDNIKSNNQAKEGDHLILTKPLGIGILASAAKELNALDKKMEGVLIEATTQINSVGSKLAKIRGVNAMTDVTGFGLLGHLLEICKGSDLSAKLNFDCIPMLEGAKKFAMHGVKTGAGARNWRSFKDSVILETNEEWKIDVLCDPQTSGGLLVTCDKSVSPGLVHTLSEDGFFHAQVIGFLKPGKPQIVVV